MSGEIDFPFICFDTEDDSRECAARVKAGVKGASMFDKRVTQIAAIAANGRQWYSGSGDVKAFLKWLKVQPEIYVYSLNMQYDLGNLFGHELDELDVTLVGSRMIKAVWGKVKFVDVYNIWFMSVKDLGDKFGLKKGELDEYSREYVFRDVEIIREAMLFIWRKVTELGLEYVPATAGSLGVMLWRAWGGETVPESNEICRDAIFGGRVEIFKTCNDSFKRWLAGRPVTTRNQEIYPNLPEDIAYTDINSLYPSQMMKAFPGHLEDTGKEIKEFGLVHASVNVPNNQEIQVLPYRTEEGKILYGYGKFTGVWTVAELQQAERDGATIDKIHACYTTDESIYPYRTYVDRVYKFRLAAESTPEKEFWKRMMNTLYGRTGTMGNIWRTVYQTENNKTSGVPYGCRVLCEYQMPLGEEVNWSHTAYITSYGRLELLKYMRLVGAEKMIYCDTDSCIFDAPGQKLPFECSKELGKMKFESWEQIAIPYAPKMYQLGGKFKAKGVPKKLQQEYIETGHAHFDLPFKFKEAVKFYDRGNVKRLSVWREIEKQNRANYDKKILKDGRYFPCKITED